MNEIEMKSSAAAVQAEREGPVPVRSYVMKKRRARAWLNKNAQGVVRQKPGKSAKRREAPADPAIRKKGKALLAVLIAVAALLVTLPAVYAVASQFVISGAEAAGDTVYTAEELLAASGLSEGESTLTLDRKAAAASVVKNLPNVKSCSVGVKYPGTVIFEIEEHTPVASIEGDDGRKYVVNSSLLVLKRADETADEALITVTPPAVSECLVGKNLSFADEMDARSLTDALRDISASGLDTAGAKLDASDRYRMSLTLSDGTLILLGSKGDLGVKLATAERLIAEGTGAGETIDVSVTGSALVRAGN